MNIEQNFVSVSVAALLVDDGCLFILPLKVSV